MTRATRSFWNFGSSLVFTGATVVTGLVATPLLVRWLGAERLGAFRTATDWLGYVTLLELGLGGALLPMLALALGRNGREGVRTVMAAGFRAYAWVAVGMLVGGGVVAVLAGRLIPVSVELHTDLRVGVLVGLLSLVWIPLSPLRSLTDASQRGHVVNLSLSVQAVTIAALSLLLARAGWGIRGQFLAVAIGTAAFYALLAFDVLRRDPAVLTWAARPAVADAGRALWRLNVPTVILQACGRVALLTDNIIVAFFMGPAAVVPFFVTQRLAAMAQAQLLAVGGATWAAMADLHAAGEHATLGRRVVELTQLVSVLGLAVMIPIGAYNHHFVALWVPGHFAGHGVTLLAVTIGLCQGVFSLWGWLFTGTGRVAAILPLTVVASLVNLVVSIAGTWAFGWLGPLLGTLMSFVLVYAWGLPLLLRRDFNVSIRALCRAGAKPLLVGLPYAVAVGWLAFAHRPWGWVGLVGEMAGAASVYLALAWAVVLCREERAGWAARLRQLRPRRRRVDERGVSAPSV